MKRVYALLLTGLLLLCLAPAAMAAGNDGSITIQNATVGKNYGIYKVFDLTYADTDPVSKVAYSYTRQTGDSDFFTALSAAASPFAVEATTVANTYNIKLKTGKGETDISSFLKAQLTAGKLAFAKSSDKDATAQTVSFTGLAYGYYYVATNNGGEVTLSSTTKAATVIDKNQRPAWDGEDANYPAASADTGKFVSATGEAGSYAKTSTAGINDTVYYKVNAFAPRYSKDMLVKVYTFTDTLPTGFSYIADTMAVALNGTALTLTTDYSYTWNDPVLTVTVPVSTDYPAEAHISITYQANVDADAVYDNLNTVSMNWTEVPWDDTAATPTNAPADRIPADSTTNTYVMGFELLKVDENDQPLSGAKFRLYSTSGETAATDTEIPVVKLADGQYRVALATETGVEIEAGSATVFGLDEGNYYLAETQAPNGYNLMKSRQVVTIDRDDANATTGIMNTVVKIINVPGTILPSTGGEGTMLFFAGGAFLLLLAAVLMITRRRLKVSC